MMNVPKKVALVHDWLVSMRGGEKVLEVLCELFPDAPLFTLVHRKGALSPTIERMNIQTSFIQHLPGGTSHYQYYLPMFPTAMNTFDLSEFEIVISSSSAVAKAVRVRHDALHICYCHTPMRYIWDQYEQYFGEDRASLLARAAVKMCRNYLQRWDVESAKGVTHFIANSRNVQERIKRIYGRDSEVIYPPVDVQSLSVSGKDDGYYLIVSALVPYKRIDLAVEAFNRLGERLLIVGSGSEERKLKAFAKKNIEFLGWASDEELRKYYAGCRALIFPGEEDFGIVPVEAMACGKPVIAYGKGGVLETVIDGVTGVLFPQQNVESLEEGVKKLATETFNANTIREQACKYERTHFAQRIETFIQRFLGNR